MIKRFDPIEGRNAEIIDYVIDCPELKNLPDDILFKLRLCVEEVEENILCYSGSTWIEVSVDNRGDEVFIKFKDGGVAFDPLAKEDPDINAPLEQRQVGGLGIFICKQMMDRLVYCYEGGCNVFEMSKKIS